MGYAEVVWTLVSNCSPLLEKGVEALSTLLLKDAGVPLDAGLL
jgi:hypothetical protein